MNFKCAYDEIVELHKLIENPKNPNKHPDRQIEMLAKIIDYQGQRSPIVVSKRSGFVVKGHGRLMAIRKLGWTSAAVDFQEYDDEAQEFADMVADNKIAELAEHDDILLQEIVVELGDFDNELLGLINKNLDSSEKNKYDFNPADIKPEFNLLIECANEDEQQLIFHDLENKGIKVKII